MKNNEEIEPELVLLKKIQKLTTKRDKLSYTIEKTISLLQETCKHTSLKKETVYHEGSYLNKSYYEYFNICNVCNKKFFIKEETGDYV